MSEFDRAKAWRQSWGFTQNDLGKQLGYSKESIFWFERGLVPPGAGKRTPKQRQIREWVWLRYKRACAGLDAELRGGAAFDWRATK